MIRLASIEDDTYVPYAETNVELTKLQTITERTFTNSNMEATIVKYGRLCMVSIVSGISDALPANTVLASLPYRPAGNHVEFVDTYGKIRMRINLNGTLINVEPKTTYIRGTVTYITND